MIENSVEYDSLISAASFSPRRLKEPNAWVGHLPFAAWLIKQIKPQIFVELGTHSGNSYFSFCQAVKEDSLSTKCYAVDTWQGDEHAGYYEEKIYNEVNDYNQSEYVDFSRLMRMTFDETVTYFDDQSIDLLHIDGLHTYEAVKHDFETWLPKITPEAVVIFHDTNVREKEFGVWKLWKEIQKEYSLNLEFVHSHGLGVIQNKNTPPEKQLQWLKANQTEQQAIKNYFSSLGARQIERQELQNLGKTGIERDSILKNLNQLIAERDSVIENFNQMISERDSVIENFNQLISERDAVIDNFNQLMVERDTVIDQFNQTTADLSEQVSNLTQVQSELTQQSIKLNQELSDRSIKITNLNNQHETEIGNFKLVIDERDRAIDMLNQTLTERDDEISRLTYELTKLHNSLSWRLTKPFRIVAGLTRHTRST